MDDLKTIFRRRFGYTPPHLVGVPTAIELLGTSSLSDDGVTIWIAIDPPLSVACAASNEGLVELTGPPDGGHEKFFATNIPATNSLATGFAVLRAVLLELCKSGVHFGGFSAAVGHSTETLAQNSAAALAVASALAVRDMYPYALTDAGLSRPPKRNAAGKLPGLALTEKKTLARLCGRAMQMCGLHNNSAAPFASLMSKAFHAVEIDSPSLALEYLPLYGEIALLLAETDVTSATPKPPDLKLTCEAAAGVLGVGTLRRLDSAQLSAHKGRLTPEQYGCAYNVIAETQRVIFASRALRENDYEQFGQYLQQSHDDGARVIPLSSEVRVLAEIARGHPGCLGVRKLPSQETTLNLVRHSAVPAFMDALAEQFRKRTGREVLVRRCLVAGG